MVMRRGAEGARTNQHQSMRYVNGSCQAAQYVWRGGWDEGRELAPTHMSLLSALLFMVEGQPQPVDPSTRKRVYEDNKGAAGVSRARTRAWPDPDGRHQHFDSHGTGLIRQIETSSSKAEPRRGREWFHVLSGISMKGARGWGCANPTHRAREGLRFRLQTVVQVGRPVVDMVVVVAVVAVVAVTAVQTQ